MLPRNRIRQNLEALKIKRLSIVRAEFRPLTMFTAVVSGPDLHGSAYRMDGLVCAFNNLAGARWGLGVGDRVFAQIRQGAKQKVGAEHHTLHLEFVVSRKDAEVHRFRGAKTPRRKGGEKDSLDGLWGA